MHDTVQMLNTSCLQVRLGPEAQKEIIKEQRTPDRLRASLDVVDIVLGFLSSGRGKAEKPLEEYIRKILKMKKPFSQKVQHVSLNVFWFHTSINLQAQKYCRLEHVLSLWQVLSVELARQTLLQNQVF